MDELKLVFPDLPYAVEEAMNRLRINVKFCGKNTKKIMLTSCLPNEGKSTVAVYLWKMLAEAGFPSVLVDVDLRNSVLMKSVQVDVSDKKGLNHYLSVLRNMMRLYIRQILKMQVLFRVHSFWKIPLHFWRIYDSESFWINLRQNTDL